MRRALLLAVVLLAVSGCPKPGPGSKGPLTEEQKIAWLKLRREFKFQGLHVAGFKTAEKEWQLRDWSGWAKEVRPPLTGKGDADEIARQVAADPYIKIAVILDLMSGDSPQIVAWVYDDGKGIKRLEGPPDADLNKTLAEFLLDLQRRAAGSGR